MFWIYSLTRVWNHLYRSMLNLASWHFLLEGAICWCVFSLPSPACLSSGLVGRLYHKTLMNWKSKKNYRKTQALRLQFEWPTKQVRVDGRCFKASVHIFICRLDIRLRKNRSQKRSTDRRAEKAIEISRDAFIFFLSISYLRKDRIEIPALRHRPGINESRIRFLLLYFEAEVRKAKALG